LGLFARPNSFLISVLKDWAGGANHEPSQCTFGFGTVVDEDESDRGDDDEGVDLRSSSSWKPLALNEPAATAGALLGDGVDAPWLVELKEEVCARLLLTGLEVRGARWATDRGGAIAPLDDAGAATGALMPTICVVPRLERNQGGSAQRGLDGSTEATLVCPVTHHCGGSGGRRGTPLMHLQLPHHMNDADVTDVHICTGSYSTRY
jgi:hypothetical protein